MTLTVLPPSAPTATSVQSGLTTVRRGEGQRAVLVLRGEADWSTRSVLADALLRELAFGAGDVVIDLAEAEFIDTAAVSILAVSQQLLARRDRKLTVRSPSRLAAWVLDVFELSGLIEAREGAQP